MKKGEDKREIGIRGKEYLGVKESAQFVLLGRFLKQNQNQNGGLLGKIREVSVLVLALVN